MNQEQLEGRTTLPLLTPEATYELEGDVPNVVFPSGALVKNDLLYVYYGAADTRVRFSYYAFSFTFRSNKTKRKRTIPIKRFTRYEGNPNYHSS